MKKSILLIISLIFLLNFNGYNFTSAKNDKKNQKKEIKLSVDEKTNIIAKELQLTKIEKSSIYSLFKSYKIDKDKIKNNKKLSKETKKALTKELKDKHQLQIKNILGKERYIQYELLKSTNVI